MVLASFIRRKTVLRFCGIPQTWPSSAQSWHWSLSVLWIFMKNWMQQQGEAVKSRVESKTRSEQMCLCVGAQHCEPRHRRFTVKTTAVMHPGLVCLWVHEGAIAVPHKLHFSINDNSLTCLREKQTNFLLYEFLKESSFMISIDCLGSNSYYKLFGVADTQNNWSRMAMWDRLTLK